MLKIQTNLLNCILSDSWNKSNNNNNYCSFKSKFAEELKGLYAPYTVVFYMYGRIYGYILVRLVDYAGKSLDSYVIRMSGIGRRNT